MMYRQGQGLKPCPFCAKDAQIRSYFISSKNIMAFFVQCPTCLARTKIFSRLFPRGNGDNKNLAIAAWNRREG